MEASFEKREKFRFECEQIKAEEVTGGIHLRNKDWHRRAMDVLLGARAIFEHLPEISRTL